MWAANPEIIQNSILHDQNVQAIEQNKFGVGELSFYKRYADKIAKEVSDKYTETMNNKLEKMGLATPGTSKKELVQTDDSKTSIYDFISLTSNGLYYIDLSTISNVDELLNKELKMITGYRYGNEEDHVTN